MNKQGETHAANTSSCRGRTHLNFNGFGAMTPPEEDEGSVPLRVRCVFDGGCLIVFALTGNLAVGVSSWVKTTELKKEPNMGRSKGGRCKN